LALAGPAQPMAPVIAHGRLALPVRHAGALAPVLPLLHMPGRLFRRRRMVVLLLLLMPVMLAVAGRFVAALRLRHGNCHDRQGDGGETGSREQFHRGGSSLSMQASE